MQPKTVFERNIEALKSNKVKYELLEYEIRTNIDIIETNGYNLAYEGQPIHNTTSPLGEAKYLFDSLLCSSRLALKYLQKNSVTSFDSVIWFLRIPTW